MTSGKLCPVSTCTTGNGMRCGQQAFDGQVEQDGGVLAPGEQERRTLEFGDHLTDDVDRLGRERIEVGEPVGHRTEDRLVTIPVRTGILPMARAGSDTRWRGPARTPDGQGRLGHQAWTGGRRPTHGLAASSCPQIRKSTSSRP